MKTANPTRQQKRIQKALDAGKVFRRCLKKLSGDAMDVAQIEAMVARVTLDLHLLKKEASGGGTGEATGGTTASIDIAPDPAQQDGAEKASPKKKVSKRPAETVATAVSEDDRPTGEVDEASGEAEPVAADQPREIQSGVAPAGEAPARRPRGKTKRTN